MRRQAVGVFVALAAAVGASASDQQLALFSIDLSQDRQTVIARTKLITEPEIGQGAFDYPTSSGTREIRMLLLHYGEYMTTSEILADMASRGLRPITFQELLWLHVAEPELQKKFPIAALGSEATIYGVRRIPYLASFQGEMLLGTHPLILSDNEYSKWGAMWRFGAIRIMQKAERSEP